jgi:hypothetical protein
MFLMFQQMCFFFLVIISAGVDGWDWNCADCLVVMERMAIGLPAPQTNETSFLADFQVDFNGVFGKPYI